MISERLNFIKRNQKLRAEDYIHLRDAVVNDGHLKRFWPARCRRHLDPRFMNEKELGLLEGDEHWQNTMSDAIISEPATKLRELFTTILIFCQPSDPLELWNKFRDALCEDILNRMRNENQDMTLAYNDDIYNDGLIIIEDKIHEISDKSLTDFGLPAAKEIILLDPLEEGDIVTYTSIDTVMDQEDVVNYPQEFSIPEPKRPSPHSLNLK
ncbi:hypothetical protein EVAR_50177_1 [Eumeta japonica]|uniref:Uncharacterized protein n=1 Tax=Eumeta variegata TaxID=151549 RepID=A0A4C1YTN3_EUMVA|nr:hypothetical protein EVAR_50177_1 [Eumeta japonica]